MKNMKRTTREPRLRKKMRESLLSFGSIQLSRCLKILSTLAVYFLVGDTVRIGRSPPTFVNFRYYKSIFTLV